MIAAAALCPAVPFLIPGVANTLATEQAGLVDAVRRAVEDVVSAVDDATTGTAGGLLVLTPGRADRWISTVPNDLGHAPFGRSAPAARRDSPEPDRRNRPLEDFAPGIWIARALVGPQPQLSALELGALQRPDGVAAAGTPNHSPTGVRHLVTSDEPIGVLVLADGATCHGDDAPAAEDARAESFDDDVHAALSSDAGPLQLRRWCRANAELAESLGATAPASLVVLAELLSGRPSSVQADYFGAPYGVGYHVARWRR